MRHAKRIESYQLPLPLHRGAERFQRWRKMRQRGALIPAPLWMLATELAATYGVCKTASALKLDYYSLKRRVSQSTSAAAADRTAFLELPPPALSAAAECIIECENSAGGKMRIHLKGVALSDLAAMGRSLWSTE